MKSIPALLAVLAIAPGCASYFELSAGGSTGQGEIIRGGGNKIASSDGSSLFGWFTLGWLLDKPVVRDYLERERRQQLVDEALSAAYVDEAVDTAVDTKLGDVLAGAAADVQDNPEAYGPEVPPEWFLTWLRVTAENAKPVLVEKPPEPDPGIDWGGVAGDVAIGIVTLISLIKGGPPLAGAARQGMTYVVHRARGRREEDLEPPDLESS